MLLAVAVFLAHLAPPAPFAVEVCPSEPRALARTEGKTAINLARPFSTGGCGGRPTGQWPIIAPLRHPARGGRSQKPQNTSKWWGTEMA
eukprot:5084705-Pyramimonas_sp.AAC.1